MLVMKVVFALYLIGLAAILSSLGYAKYVKKIKLHSSEVDQYNAAKVTFVHWFIVLFIIAPWVTLYAILTYPFARLSRTSAKK